MSPMAWLYHYTDARSLAKLLDSRKIEAYDQDKVEVETGVYLTELQPCHSTEELTRFYYRYGYKVRGSDCNIGDGLYYLKVPAACIGSLDNVAPKIYTTRKACIDLNGFQFKVGKTRHGRSLWEVDSGTCWIVTSTDTAECKPRKQYEERQPQSKGQLKPRGPKEEDLLTSQLYTRQGSMQCGAPAGQLEYSLETLDAKTRRRITTIVSLAVADHGRQSLDTISKILGYNDLLNKGKRSKDAVRDMIEWAATEGQKIERLQLIFNEFRIKPGICSFLDHISTAHTELRHHLTMPPPPEQLIVNDSSSLPSLSKTVKNIATEAAKIPGLRLSRFHCFEDMMKIYVDLEGDNLQEAESKLKQLARDQGYTRGVHIHDEKPPGVSPCCGPNVCLGGKVLVSRETGEPDPVVVARVSGYLTTHDGTCKYATTVGHVFDQSTDDYCLLSEFANPDQRRIGECVAKISNVSPEALRGIGEKRQDIGFYDISFIELLDPESARITNRFCGIKNPLDGIKLRLQPFMERKAITEFHHYLSKYVYVVNTTREGSASVGRVTDVVYTGKGIPSFLSVGLQLGAQFLQGDSGSLVTGVDWMTADLQVPAYGLVVGVLDTTPAAPTATPEAHVTQVPQAAPGAHAAPGTQAAPGTHAAPGTQASDESAQVVCVLPFWPQVDQLCLEHWTLLWAQRDQLEFFAT